MIHIALNSQNGLSLHCKVILILIEKRTVSASEELGTSNHPLCLVFNFYLINNFLLHICIVFMREHSFMCVYFI